MRKIVVMCLMISFLTSTLSSQVNPRQDKKMEWWRDARFGMFIHWGVYAVPGGVYNGEDQRRGGAEWFMNRMKIPVQEYMNYAKQFNPVKFDANAWVKIAKDAGMKYIVITTKHHDGFALFKSQASKWNIVDATPYGKDIIKELADACRKEGIKLGFYYSHAQDWVNPGGSVARKVTTEGWLNPDSAKIDKYTEEYKGHWDAEQMRTTMADYMQRVAIPQVKELISNYGDVAVIWWDTPTNMKDEFAIQLKSLIDSKPDIITNDRLKRPNFPGDYRTPEQKIPDLSELDGKDWETCMTMNKSWGYDRRKIGSEWKSEETLIRNLIDIASKGGNYLLNVGPNAEGEFPKESIDRLEKVGAWMKKNGESIYGTKSSPFKPLSWGRCTQKDTMDGTILYFSVFDWPSNGILELPEMKNKVISARILENGKSVRTKSTTNGLVIKIPAKAINPIATVIRVDVKGQIKSDKLAVPTTKMKTGELD